MLSVLIPVYNEDIRALVHTIHDQAKVLGIPFEICCVDDHSEYHITQKNLNVLLLPHTTYSISAKNKGRERTRQLLSERASYNNLLFLDADTMPVHADFVKTYVGHINGAHEAVFGGIVYEDAIPPQEARLRWTYGIRHESQRASERNKHPYRAITSPNFMIAKPVFQALNSQITGKAYGYDIYFAKLMRTHNIKTLHIDNDVVHLGLENNDVYLQKSQAALRTYLELWRSKAIDSKDNKLIATFVTLRSLKLNYILYGCYKLFKAPMERNLLGANPSMWLFQWYRLSYLCHADIALNRSHG